MSSNDCYQNYTKEPYFDREWSISHTTHKGSSGNVVSVCCTNEGYRPSGQIHHPGHRILGRCPPVGLPEANTSLAQVFH